MATIRTNTNHTYYAVLTLTEGSYNIEANTSPVRYNLTLYNGIQNFEGYTIGYKIIINGVQVAYHDNSGNQTSMAANSSKTVATGSTTITHNTDGTKTISASVEIWTNNASYLPVSLSGSGSMTLATIPRASTPTLSASSFSAGSALTIYTNRASSSFTHTLKYTLNGTTGDIATGVGTSYTWNDTKALASLIPNASSGTVTITCYTYNGSTHIGTKTVTATITIPNTEDFMPVISGISVADANNLAEKYRAYVQGKSTPVVTISATANYSSIKSYKVTFQGIAVTATTNVLSLASVTSTGSLDIVVTVTDGRGRTATKTETIEALAYNSPIVSARVVRCNSNGVDNDEGAFIKVSCSAEVVALNDFNSKDITLQYRLKGATDWTTAKTWTVYLVNEDVVIAADVDHSFDIQLVATDDFATSTYGAEIGTVAVTIDYHESGKGIAIGKVAESEGFEVDWEAKFNKDVKVDGSIIVDTFNVDGTLMVTDVDHTIVETEYLQLVDLLNGIDEDHVTPDFGVAADYVVEQGEDGIWTYRKWNSGIAECWTNTTTTGGSSTEGNLYWMSCAINFPTNLFIETPEAFPSMQGNWIGGIQNNNSLSKTTWGGYMWTATKQNTYTFTVRVYAKGRWK